MKNKSKSPSTVNVSSNVRVRTIDRFGQVTRTSDIHNKATVNLVDGLLRFLKGDFTSTSYSSSVSPEEGVPYLPTKVSFGYIGVDLTSESPASPDGKRHFDFINDGKFVQPVFLTTSLQEPCTDKIEESLESQPIKMTFDKINQVGYSDSNNAEALELSIYIPPGTLVGKVIEVEDKKVFSPFSYSYWNPSIGEYEAMITEIGLVSDMNVLLARVLFDGKVNSDFFYDKDENNLGKYPVVEDVNNEYNPITQSQSSTVVITWTIGIVSVGKNDIVVTENDLTVKTLSDGLSTSILNKYKVYDESSGEPVEVSQSELSEYINSETLSILDGRILTEINKE